MRNRLPFVGTALLLAVALALAVSVSRFDARSVPEIGTLAATTAKARASAAPAKPAGQARTDKTEGRAGPDKPKTAPADKPTPAAKRRQPEPAPAPDHIEDMKLGCGFKPAAPEAPRGVACRWSRANHPRADGYRLWRGTDKGRDVIFRTGDLDETHHLDSGVVAGHTYHYLVEAVAHGAEGPVVVGRSNPVKVTVERPMDHLRLSCQPGATEAGRGIACKWSASEHPGFAAYRLWRGPGHDDQRVVVFKGERREETHHFDADVRPGHTYVYLVEVLNAAGDVIGRSDSVKVAFGEERRQELRLSCAATAMDGRRGVACRWSEVIGPSATAYALFRSVDGGPRAVVHRDRVGEPTHFFDTDVAAGHTYVYALVAYDAAENVVAQGGPVKVGSRGTP